MSAGLHQLSPVAQVAYDAASRPEERRRQVENVILNEFDTSLRLLVKAWLAAVRTDVSASQCPRVRREAARQLVRVTVRLHAVGAR